MDEVIRMAINETSVNKTTLAKPDWEIVQAFGGGMSSSSGQTVNEITAFNLSAFYAGSSIISSDIAGLDLYIYSETNTGRKRVYKHPLLEVLCCSPNQISHGVKQ